MAFPILPLHNAKEADKKTSPPPAIVVPLLWKRQLKTYSQLLAVYLAH